MKSKIAIIDSDENSLQLAKKALTQAGYSVNLYPEPAEVLSRLRDWQPDLIFLELVLPGITGFSLLKELKSQESLKKAKVFIFSAKNYASDRKLTCELGADGFFEKPFTEEQLLEKVEQIMGGRMKIRFWGTRGSIPSPGESTLKYGGNTPCVEVRLSNEELLVFDAGTGIRELGNFLLNKRNNWQGHIFLSHPHWDHIQGLPFFRPAYIPGNEFIILGAAHPQVSLEKIIADQMETIYFPINVHYFSADVSFKSLGEGSYKIGGAQIDTMFINHPGLALSYKINWGNSSMVYMTDNELGMANGGNLRKRIVEFVSQANVLIHDAQYDDDEYKIKRGWGHSTWSQALQLAMEARVERLVLFHHDPDHDDQKIDTFLAACQQEAKNNGASLEIIAAQEGMEILL